MSYQGPVSGYTVYGTPVYTDKGELVAVCLEDEWASKIEDLVFNEEKAATAPQEEGE